MTRKILAPLVLAMLSTPMLAAAEDYMNPVTDPVAQEECSACHMAFPAGFLPARSWDRIMNTLDDHFGENAGLDDATRAAIGAYFVANAADAGGRNPRLLRGVDPAATPLRITELQWWTREHNHEVSARQWDQAKSPANCAACHRGAERGYFED
jgi:hypothetical protein